MLKSTIPMYPNPIDSRCLQFELNYYMLNKHQTDRLMKSFYDWCLSFGRNQYIGQWYWGSRKISVESIPCRISQSGSYSFGFEANFISDVVYDKKTYKANKEKLFADISVPLIELSCSQDYFPFYDQQFRDTPKTANDWINSILSFFNEKNRICISPVAANDINAFAYSCQYRNNNNMYYGAIRFSVYLYCISNIIASVAGNMIQLLRNLSASYVNLNARILLSPICSAAPYGPHMTYFGSNVEQDGSHISVGALPSEWYKSYYLLGAEWYNIISPLAQRHLPNLMNDIPQHKNIAFEQLDTGGVAVWVKKEIINTDVDDLVSLKHLLYPALYPGKMCIEKKHILSRDAFGLISKPRKQWELLPVFENEIIISDTHIIFQHQTQ